MSLRRVSGPLAGSVGDKGSAGRAATSEGSPRALTGPRRVDLGQPPAGPTRSRLRETLRQDAQHKLVEAQEAAAVRGRHAAHYLALAEQAAPALYGHEQLATLFG